MLKKIKIIIIICILLPLMVGISLGEDSFDSHVSNGNAYFVNVEYEKAAREYEKAIVLKSKNIKILSQLAYCYYYLNDLNTSLDYLEKISKINDKYPELHFRTGYIYETNEEYDKAIREYKKAIMYNDNKPEAFYSMGIVYNKRGDLKESIRKLREAVKLGRKFAGIYYLIGSNFDRLGHYSEAVNAYLTAYKIDKKNIQIFYQIGIIKKRLYKYPEAITYFKKFMKLSKEKSLATELYLEAQGQIKLLGKRGLPKGKYLTYESEKFAPFTFKISHLDEFIVNEKKFQGKIIAEFNSLLGGNKILISMLPMEKEESIIKAYLRGWGIDLTKNGFQDDIRVKNLKMLEKKNSRKFNLVVKSVESGKVYNNYLTSVIFIDQRNLNNYLFEIQVPMHMIPRGVLNKAILTFKLI